MSDFKKESDIYQKKEDLFFIQILKSFGKFGRNGIIYFGLVFTTFSIINSISLGIAIFKINITLSTSSYFLAIFLIYIVGLLFLTIAIYLTYRSFKMDALYLIYKHSSVFFEKLCLGITDKITSSNIQILNINKENFNTIINIGSIAANLFGNRTPKYIQKGITFILSKVPFVNIIFDLKDVIISNNQNNASKSIYREVNNYVLQSVFGINSMRWLYWLIPINVSLQTILIYFFVQITK